MSKSATKYTHIDLSWTKDSSDKDFGSQAAHKELWSVLYILPRDGTVAPEPHQILITCPMAAVRKSKTSSQLCVAAFTFCQQVTPQEYEDQREATTLESLKQLLRDISSSKTIPVKERRRLLKEFEKHHPVVFLQHFSSTFWNIQLKGIGLTS